MPVVSCSFEHHTGDRTIWLDSTLKFDRKHLGDGQGSTTFLPLPPTSQKDLQLNGYLEYSHAAQALHTFINIMPSPGFKYRPCGTAVSVTYTIPDGWLPKPTNIQEINFS
ncbi:uncharacterized protein TNCV_2749981 [Trichonephila clavipes]|nr:uncharacterized protein TNCV_2749981 [Trichonephila clavipes]